MARLNYHTVFYSQTQFHLNAPLFFTDLIDTRASLLSVGLLITNSAWSKTFLLVPLLSRVCYSSLKHFLTDQAISEISSFRDALKQHWIGVIVGLIAGQSHDLRARVCVWYTVGLGLRTPLFTTNFPSRKRLGWRTVSRITNTQAGNSGKLRVSARESVAG
jgi:hypothetical protein